MGPIPASWPDDVSSGSGNCGASPPTLNSATNSSLSFSPPTLGRHTFVVTYTRTSTTPAGARDSQAVSAISTVSYIVTNNPRPASGVGASATGTTSMNVSWTASPDAAAMTDYILYRDGVEIARPIKSATSFGDSGLTSNTQYCYTLKAHFHSGTSDFLSTVSNQGCATTQEDTNNTPPTVVVSGVSNMASYEFGSVPSAMCDVTDAEDGNPSFAATLSAITGPHAADGIGSQTASCNYTDGGGLSDSDSAMYEIVDTTAPVITVPGDITTTATSPSGAVVNYTASSSDAVDPNPSLNCTPPSGSTFPVGDTTVNCSSDDYNMNHATASFNVHVNPQGNTAPNITKLAKVLTASIPLNLIPVKIQWAATDADGIDHYTLEESVNGGPFNPVTLSNPLALNVTRNLTSGSTYAYTLTAYDNNANQASNTKTITFTPQKQEEAPVANVVFYWVPVGPRSPWAVTLAPLAARS